MAPVPDLSRRTLLAAIGGLVGAGAVGCGEDDAVAPTESGKVVYGDAHPAQYGVLALPDSAPVGLVVLLHGGFWLAQYGLDLMDPLAADLNRRGYATWNVEYRRVGDGGGYPETFEDVAAAIDHLATIPEVDGLPVSTVGHSAGGHLAVWAAGRLAKTPGGAPKVVPSRTISLGGVLDLTSAAETNLGGGAATALMGAAPAQARAAYALADPSELVPAAGAVTAVCGEADQIVPREQSSAFVALDVAAGGKAALVDVPGDHFALIDARSAAWAKVVQLLGQ